MEAGAAASSIETTAAATLAEITPEAAAAPTIAEEPKKRETPQSVPESFGARLEHVPPVERQDSVTGLPPMEGNENLTAAERRDAFLRRSRTSRAVFAAVVLLAIGAVGYYGYEHRVGQDADGRSATASTADRNAVTPAEPQPVVAEANREAAPATTAAPPATPS